MENENKQIGSEMEEKFVLECIKNEAGTTITLKHSKENKEEKIYLTIKEYFDVYVPLYNLILEKTE